MTKSEHKERVYGCVNELYPRLTGKLESLFSEINNGYRYEALQIILKHFPPPTETMQEPKEQNDNSTTTNSTDNININPQS